MTPSSGPQQTRQASEPAGSRLVRALKHAFAVHPEHERLNSHEQDILEKVAEGVARRGLAAPAVMLLESVHPLNFLGSQALAFFEPILAVALDADKCQRFRQLVGKRAAVPALIRAIERCQGRKG